MFLSILIILGLIFVVEEIIFDFNDDLVRFKKYKPKINILIINGFIIIMATIIFFMTNNKYDIDNNGDVNFNDVIVLKNYLLTK